METLRYIREQAGLSQPELSELSGVAQGTISDIERGKRKPRGRTLRKLAQVLGVEVADLLGESETLKVQPRLPNFNGGPRMAIDYRACREALDLLCLHWERRVLHDDLDQRSLDEFGTMIEVFIVPLLEQVANAERAELRDRYADVVDQRPSILLDASVLAPAGLRFIELGEQLARAYHEKFEESAPAGATVTNLQDVRERLTSIQHRAAG